MSILISPENCFHCGLPNTVGNCYPVLIHSVSRFMCCPGCQAVAQAIVDNGLSNYYEFRTEAGMKGDVALNNTLSQLAIYDEPELQEEFVFDEGSYKSIQLTVEGITCPACAWLIEKQLGKLPGIKQISVNVSARRAVIKWDANTLKLSEILARLKSVGYKSLPFQADAYESSYKKEQKSFLKKLGLSGIMTMQVMMLAIGQYLDILGTIDEDTVTFFNAISLLLTTPVVLYSGSIFYISAYKSLMARTVNMDVPITIAIFATYIAGVLAVNNRTGQVYFESICMFVFFLTISRYLEHRARHKASLISANMLKLIPVSAQKKVGDVFVPILAKQLVKDDIVLIKAGETVPIDGRIIEGISCFDESMLTGEFEPCVKSVGKNVYAGSVNKQSAIVIQVEAAVKYAMMNQILRLQELAMANKPKMAAIADKLSQYFVITVLLLAAATYIFWTLIDEPNAFWITISVLVATCPCALGLATPTALTCAMAKLNRVGILLKRANALEQLTNVTDIIFDKTGTLTQGKFSINRKWLNSNCSEYLNINDDKLENYIIGLAHCIEVRSEHPISSAFKQLIEESKQEYPQYNLTDFEVKVGQGVRAIVNGAEYYIGSQAMILPLIRTSTHSDLIAIDGANVLLAYNGIILAAFWINDTVQTEAAATLAQLDSYNLVILSGDTQFNVENIASKLHIDDAVGDKTPQAKLDYIKALQLSGKRVVMLGDGINDAPVLAGADVSIAVGNATDLAKNAADVILMNPNLQLVIELLIVAKKTKNKIKQNIAWALGYNMLVLPFAVAGWLSPWQAALGMSLSSVVVVYNSTRLMR